MRFLETKWPAFLFWPFSQLFAVAMLLRNKSYDYQISSTYRLECPVISIGNIVVGGTGKTPTVSFLAKWLLEKNMKVGILSRGYGRKGSGPIVVSDGEKLFVKAEYTGDEPLLLAKQLPGVPVVVDRDRVRGGKILLKTYHPDVIILDDGFQHRRLYRDIDIVTFKSTNSLGNRFLLPAGPLRESVSQLSRAHLFWVNGVKQKQTPQYLSVHKNIPIVQADYGVHSIYNQFGIFNPSLHPTNSVVAFCGLANPQSFFRTIQSSGIHISAFITFKDHHVYSKKNLDKIKHVFREEKADFILTTEKDWVKIINHFQLDDLWYSLSIKIQPEDARKTDFILSELCKKGGFL